MQLDQIALADIGTVNIVRKKGMRNVRLRIDQTTGEIILSCPRWFPAPKARQFVIERKEWLLKQSVPSEPELVDGVQLATKTILKINLVDQKRISSRITKSQLTINVPIDIEAKRRKLKIRAVVLKHLENESRLKLIFKLEELSRTNGYKINSVKIRTMKSRWGSCSHKNNITLSSYLVQLPEELIEYVILHELAHTKYLNHSSKFWNLMEQTLPKYKKRRLELKSYRPMIYTV